MLTSTALIALLIKTIAADIASEDVQFLNELPLDKLLRMKASLQELVESEMENVTSSPAMEKFGAQAMAVKGLPIKRGDYEEIHHKHDYHDSKISKFFSMSVTTLAFLAFGGYLLCLIVQAVKAKQMYNYQAPTTAVPTFFISSGIKKRPQAQFASYGRSKRDYSARRLQGIDLPPEQMFSALLHLCEGYAKWSERYGNEY